MPTGYTSKIYEGQEQKFESFLLDCAKQFGANISLRDSPSGASIVKYKPDTEYYERRLADSHNRLEKATQMSLEEAQASLDDERSKLESSMNNNKQRKLELEVRYRTVLSEAMQWTPPTPEHQALKDFAIEQLTMSIDFDCSYHESEINVKTAEEYLQDEIEGAHHDIKYYENKIKEEIERTEQRNKWNEELFNSLGMSVPNE